MAASHALAVIACSSSPQSCPASEADASAGGVYLVVFGSGRGVVRSREQAVTDIYEALRDRTALGERLDAEVMRRDATATPSAPRGSMRRPTTQSEASANPVARCAFLLLDLVDDRGEVALDVVHWSGLSGCTVSLGASDADGGAPQCLIDEPERSHRSGGKPGFSW